MRLGFDPLSRALLNVCVFKRALVWTGPYACFHRTRVDGSPICEEKVAFSYEDGYMWTGP